MKQVILAMTGASGAPYGQRLCQLIASQGVHLHIVISSAGREVLADELGITKPTVAALLGHAADNVTFHSPRAIGARIASGSFRTHGMIICPCSSNTLAAVANGVGDSLVTRAAMVTLKERRRLILVHREMPVSAIELENMLKVTHAGAIVCPACPGFYKRPQSVGDLVDFVCGRVLDLLDLPHELDIRWNPDEAVRGRSAPPGDAGGGW